jgi:hypothetical protein
MNFSDCKKWNSVELRLLAVNNPALPQATLATIQKKDPDEKVRQAAAARAGSQEDPTVTKALAYIRQLPFHQVTKKVIKDSGRPLPK